MFNEYCQVIRRPERYAGGVARREFCSGKDMKQKRTELEKVYGKSALQEMLAIP